MISFYWPGKKVPTWFLKIRFDHPQERDNPYVAHSGLGVILLVSNSYHVLPILKDCIELENCNDVLITGQKDGVLFHQSFWVGILTLLIGAHK